MSKAVGKFPAYNDAVGCQAVLLEWAESFDTKDWDRLSRALAPSLYVDYTQVMGQRWESMPAEDFVAMASNAHFLGNRRIKTQHFIGAGSWTQAAEDHITGYFQMRVAHQKYSDDELSTVLYQGHAHGKATVHCRKIDDVWKFAGLEPDIRWAEHDYDKIFQPE
ncbi:hypothetical protein N8I77_007202 [Diaporthe amygdali]|uniref:Scytalone dehydratase-like domain-containing protein n=1 Tax=Phomopsis amygdali TaxID=1214568 RepID=A0AAD9SCP2_PHOAM|nr:hypothetical protein N8I77_007202 [Diaporthe amygdali]